MVTLIQTPNPSCPTSPLTFRFNPLKRVKSQRCSLQIFEDSAQILTCPAYSRTQIRSRVATEFHADVINQFPIRHPFVQGSHIHPVFHGSLNPAITNCICDWTPSWHLNSPDQQCIIFPQKRQQDIKFRTSLPKYVSHATRYLRIKLGDLRYTLDNLRAKIPDKFQSERG